MAGAGFLTVLVLAVLLPFEFWRERAQAFRMLPPFEQNLRRTANSVGMLVLGLLAGQEATGNVGHALVALAPHTTYDWPPAVLLAVIAALLAARFFSGWRGCALTRDPVLTPLLCLRAVLKLAFGGLVVGFFYSIAPLRLLLNPPDAALWLWAAFLVGVWCVVTGAVRLLRLLLLSASGGSALTTITKMLQQRDEPMRPVRRRS